MSLEDDDDRLSEDQDWIEADNEIISIQSFVNKSTFDSLEELNNNILALTGIDFLQFLTKEANDEYNAIQIVNYLRANIDKNNFNCSFKQLIHGVEEHKHCDPRYFKPVIENDQLLQLIPDIFDIKFDQSSQPERTVEVSKNEVESSSETSGDEYYFDGYGESQIHLTMLKDQARNDAYYEALKLTASNKTVLDVGSGTGILSLFALIHGADFVVSIENSNIVYTALQVLHENDLKMPHLGLKNKILILKGKAEDLATKGLVAVHVPNHPSVQELFKEVGSHVGGELLLLNKKFSFDILVSEWMGYGLFFEGMLDSVISVRDIALKPEAGVMIPSSCSIFMELKQPSGVDLGNIHGLDFSCIADKNKVLRAQIVPVDQKDIVSSRVKMSEFDLATVSIEELDFNSETIELEVQRDVSSIEGFVLTFDCVMIHQDIGKVILTTACDAKSTHWAQTLLQPPSFQEIMVLPKGTRVLCKLGYSRQLRNKRNLNIHLYCEATHKQEKQHIRETFLLS